jgi:hypothetical protein
MKFYSNPKIVSKTPLITFILLEGGNVQQLYRMWSTWTSAGQSLWGWVCVNIALILWCNFYRVCCPNEKFAFWATVVGVVINACVIFSVAWFRYFVGT